MPRSFRMPRFPSRSVLLLSTAVLAILVSANLAWAIPAAAQRATVRQAPAEMAEALRAEQAPASTVARRLRAEHRQSALDAARTLKAAGYLPAEVGAALAAEYSVDGVELFDVFYQGDFPHREITDGLRGAGVRVDLDCIGPRGDPAPCGYFGEGGPFYHPTSSDVARDAYEAGLSPDQIFDVLEGAGFGPNTIAQAMVGVGIGLADVGLAFANRGRDLAETTGALEASVRMVVTGAGVVLAVADVVETAFPSHPYVDKARALKDAGFGPDDNARAQKESWGKDADEGAGLQQQLDYRATTNARQLKEVWNQTALEAAALLRDVGYTAVENGRAQRETYGHNHAQGGHNLKSAGYGPGPIARAQRSVWSRTAEQTGAMLAQLDFMLDEIAEAVHAEFDVSASALASMMWQLQVTASANQKLEAIGHALSSLYGLSSAEIAHLLADLGIGS